MAVLNGAVVVVGKGRPGLWAYEPDMATVTPEPDSAHSNLC